MVYPGKYYGTLKSELQRIWDLAKSPLIDIDVQGALAVSAQFPNISCSIFIEAPSLEELRQRLIKRGSETEKTLEERIEKAKIELTFAPRFDRIIINEQLETATNELIQLVEEFTGCR